MRCKRTRRLSPVLCAVAVLFLAVSPVAAQRIPDHTQLKYPNLRDVAVPEVQRVTLSNGMRLFLLEDRELPLISLSGRIRVGSIYEPAEKVGLADITGEVMRTGGTMSKTGDELDDELEQIAASVETGIGQDSGYASVSVLEEDIDRGLAILADVLMHPAFRQDKIELAKMQHRSAIARRNDSPRSVASREFNKLIHGPDSAYARHTEYATIDNISRDDLVAFHKRFFGPNNMMLAVWGDFDTQEMIARIEKAFDGWEKIDLDLPAKPEVDYAWRSSVNLVSRDDLNQSNIYLGHLGGRMSDPDYPALTLMNHILGGGFTGRLFKNVRSRQGLAYSVFGTFSAQYDRPGVFSLGCQTKSESTVHAIEAIVEEVRRIVAEPVTDEELELAKDSYLNSFIFHFDSTDKIVRRLMTYEYYGYPPDFLQTTKERIEKVTKADILRAARARLRPDALQILVVGRPEDFDRPLATLGEVRSIDVTIPPPVR
ncbi:M16 family metallopeptidase [Anaerobaca lacustris]|uniref:Pitrilysin family protein n=1 Tax=Anaerobaca lacustris TaxID=3044600 RepID=A0AAW6TPF0_9BACT|nr:pitrilysin family protein [Sedimentisphaerales bacterium M17dextr]